MRTISLRPNLVLLLACALTLLLFLVDIAVPDSHFWGRYLLPILVVFLWGRRRDIFVVTALACALVVGDYWLEGAGGANDLLMNHVLPVAVLLLIAWVLAQRQRAQDRLLTQRAELLRHQQEMEQQVAARTTELQTTLAALRRSQAQLDKLFRANPGAIAISRVSEGCFRDANPAYLQLLGYARDELIGCQAIWTMPPPIAPPTAALPSTTSPHASAPNRRCVRARPATRCWPIMSLMSSGAWIPPAR